MARICERQSIHYESLPEKQGSAMCMKINMVLLVAR